MVIVELLQITPDAEKVIETAGRTAYLSFDKETRLPLIQGENGGRKRVFRAEEFPDLKGLSAGQVFEAEGLQWTAVKVWKHSAEKFVEMLVKSGHFSVLEHACATFRLTGGSRAFTHQLVRHRMASFTQQSQRYVDENSFHYVEPPSIARNPEAHDLYSRYMEHARSSYLALQKLGIRNEDARFVLPNSVASEIVVSADLREWRHIIEIRGNAKAQWEIREAAFQIYQVLSQRIPSAFIDMRLDQKNDTVQVDN